MGKRPNAPLTEIVILTKAPDPARSKTRLAPLPPTLRQAISAAMIEDTVVYTLNVCESVTLACDPGPAHPFFQDIAQKHTVNLCNQGTGDLGARLEKLLLSPPMGAKNVVFLGSDCPHLPPQILNNALEALNQYDAVMAPAMDGGYVLIGLSPKAASLLHDIPWSTAAVAQVTQERARESRLSLHLLAGSFDIDEPVDLHRLRQSHPKTSAPHTRVVLETFASQGGVIYGDGP